MSPSQGEGRGSDSLPSLKFWRAAKWTYLPAGREASPPPEAGRDSRTQLQIVFPVDLFVLVC
jgi:hypothetical protein